MSSNALSPAPLFSQQGAQDNNIVAREAQEWIEEVTGQNFKSGFRESLEDGVLLCQLMKRLSPGSISRINKLKSPIAHLDNIQQFLNACRNIGMSDSQLFDMMDLQASTTTPKKLGVKRDEADRKIRSVCVTLYWLGRKMAEKEEYKGPQLDLSVFSSLLNTQDSEDDDESFGSPIPPDHYQLEVGNHLSSPEPAKLSTEINGLGLTFEQEQTADQLLADIQSAVDEMLIDFQATPLEQTPNRLEEPPKVPEATRVNEFQFPIDDAEEIEEDTEQSVEDVEEHSAEQQASSGLVGVSLHMTSRNGGFGFQFIGGADANYHPEVEMVLPGSAAEDAGIRPGDKLISVNKQDVRSLTHFDLVSLIKQAGSEGSMLLGLARSESRHLQTSSATELDDIMEELSEEEEAQVEDQEANPDNNEQQNNDEDEEDNDLELDLSIGTQSDDEDDEEEFVEDPVSIIPPPPVSSYSRGQPLPTLVEYQEEAMLEQFTEMLEKSPPPPEISSPQPSPPGSPTVSPAPVSDDRESIERELQELVLMEIAANSEQKFKQQDDDTPSEEQPNIEDEIEELLSLGRQSKSPEFDLAIDLPPPMFVSPPPPKPTTEAPKRQAKASPPPVKEKPKKRPASFVQATVVSPVETELRAKSSTPTNVVSESPVQAISLPPPKSPSPVDVTIEEVEAPSPQITQATDAIDGDSFAREISAPVTPASQTVQVKELGAITPDDVEIVGSIKIQKVQRTRWTPKGSSIETPPSSEEQHRHRYQQHYTQQNHWAMASNALHTTPSSKQNGFHELVQQVQQQTARSPKMQRMMPPNSTAPGGSSPQMSKQPAPIRGSPKKTPPDPRRHTQPVSMASWQPPTTFDDSQKTTTSNRVLSPPIRSTTANWKSQEELRMHRVDQSSNAKQDPWSHIAPRPQHVNRTQTLPKGSSDNWRVARHNTWSRGTAPRTMDGQQSAFAIKTKNPYDLCSKCHKPLGTDMVMSIPNLRAQYHIPCFTCRVCRTPLVRSAHNTSVHIKGMHPHCKFCGSNDQGMLMTEC